FWIRQRSCASSPAESAEATLNVDGTLGWARRGPAAGGVPGGRLPGSGGAALPAVLWPGPGGGGAPLAVGGGGSGGALGAASAFSHVAWSVRLRSLTSEKRSAGEGAMQRSITASSDAGRPATSSLAPRSTVVCPVSSSWSSTPSE